MSKRSIYLKKDRLDAIIKLGGKCAECGCTEIICLQIDHINNDGAKERRHRQTINRKIARGEVDPNKYQLLCANCNWRKELLRREKVYT